VQQAGWDGQVFLVKAGEVDNKLFEGARLLETIMATNTSMIVRPRAHHAFMWTETQNGVRPEVLFAAPSVTTRVPSYSPPACQPACLLFIHALRPCALLLPKSASSCDQMHLLTARPPACLPARLLNCFLPACCLTACPVQAMGIAIDDITLFL
jgi:hypothetical protein